VTPSEAMSEQQEGDIPVVAVCGGGSVKLLPFWPHAPQLWFSQAECLFMVNNVSNQFHRYCLVVSTLQHDSLRRVADIVVVVDLAARCLIEAGSLQRFGDNVAAAG
jgi:hypothetical protein